MAESDDYDPALLQAVVNEVGQHAREAVGEMDEREQMVIDETRAAELAELEESGYWHAGFIDDDADQAEDFDHAQDYEDAVGHVADRLRGDIAAGMGTPRQRSEALEAVNEALTVGEAFTIRLGQRTFFVAEMAGSEAEAIDVLRDRYEKAQSETHGYQI